MEKRPILIFEPGKYYKHNGSGIVSLLSFANDPNTGWYYSGSNKLSVSFKSLRPFQIVITFFGEDRYPKIVTWCKSMSKPYNMSTKIFPFFGVRGKDMYEQYFKKEIPGRIEVYQIQRSKAGEIGKLEKLDDIPGIINPYNLESKLAYNFVDPADHGEAPKDNKNRFDLQIAMKEGLELAEEIEKYREAKV